MWGTSVMLRTEAFISISTPLFPFGGCTASAFPGWVGQMQTVLTWVGEQASAGVRGALCSALVDVEQKCPFPAWGPGAARWGAAGFCVRACELQRAAQADLTALCVLGHVTWPLWALTSRPIRSSVAEWLRRVSGGGPWAQSWLRHLLVLQRLVPSVSQQLPPQWVKMWEIRTAPAHRACSVIVSFYCVVNRRRNIYGMLWNLTKIM